MLSLKGRIFNDSTDFKKSWGVLAKIQKYNSQNLSNGGAFTGLAIQSPKETTLKGQL
jgi:hypothetical protein